jgi:hypothetical protein
MSNKDVLNDAFRRLGTQVTLDSAKRQEWITNLKKRHHDHSSLKAQLTSEIQRHTQHLDEAVQSWIRTGQLPSLRQEIHPFLWERFHCTHSLATLLQDGGCQIFERTEQRVLEFLFYDCKKLSHSISWIESL